MRGYTVVELIITMIIVVILGFVAYPAYLEKHGFDKITCVTTDDRVLTFWANMRSTGPNTYDMYGADGAIVAHVEGRCARVS